MRWNWRNSKDTFVLQFHANPLPNTFITGLSLLNIYIYMHAARVKSISINFRCNANWLLLLWNSYHRVKQKITFYSISVLQKVSTLLKHFFFPTCVYKTSWTVSSKIESLTMIGQAIEFLQRRDKIGGFAERQITRESVFGSVPRC